jgi:hypothetical protein
MGKGIMEQGVCMNPDRSRLEKFPREIFQVLPEVGDFQISFNNATFRMETNNINDRMPPILTIFLDIYIQG